MAFSAHRRKALDSEVPLPHRLSHVRSCAMHLGQKYGIHQDQSDKPFAKFKRGHGIPGEPGTQREHGRVIDSEKTSQGFVGNMRAKGEAKQEPGKAKAARPNR